MGRENFYILLELSINPPENNQKIIELTIKKKQIEWSRLRNHPAKALKAKQYIGLLSEIRRVMIDPELRKTEALNAKKILLKRAAEKNSVIDRHLTIYMSKGFITDKEIFNLAKRHSVKVDTIQKRIQQKEDKKFTQIEKQLKLRTAKGYISKDEISELAESFSVGEKEIIKKIICPIKKKINESIEPLKPLDQAIAKDIDQNLKICGKSSLYQFLDLMPDSSLKKLQKKAKEKNSELHKIDKKDALTTTGIILAGHCLTIFSNQESRNSYDMTTASSLFKDLNSDIDMAGMDGIIRAEYYDVLIDSAVTLGMSKNEASEYIKNYADQKTIQIEIKAKRSPWIAYAVIIAVALVIGVGTVIFLYKKNQYKLQKAYQLVLADMQGYRDLHKKEQILFNYIKSHKNSKHTIDAEKRLKNLHFSMDELKAKEFIINADKFLAEKKYQKAGAVYQDFINKYPQSLYADKIIKKITELSTLLEEIDYKKLGQLKDQPIYTRAMAYFIYLTKYSQGKYVKNVKERLPKMCEEYYIALIKEIAVYQKNEDWEKGILLCDDFIKIYKDNKRAVEIKEQLNIMRTRLWEKETYAQMLQKVKAKGNNFQAAKSIFADYLQAYPDSYINAKIKAELAKLEEKELIIKNINKKERLTNLIKKSGKRFLVNQNGTVKDKTTGLTWCLADSLIDTGDCLSYDAAIKYVKELKTGGYQDWRLPTSNELTQLYKQKPFFPQDDAEWYWTSKNYSRYSDGWSKVVDIITPKNELMWKKEARDSLDCGSVRAVRK